MENFRVRMRMQLAEALGEVNRYFYSLTRGAEVENEEKLVRYFIESGGAADFARRYGEAMGALNRYYCSEFYGYDVDDPEMLWEHYMSYRQGGPGGRRGRVVGAEAARR